MSNNMTLNTTVYTRSASVAPMYLHVMGDVCPQTAAGNSAAWLKRHNTDAFKAITTPGSGLPWSPPVI